jgi:hypothetical protein
MPRYTEVNYTIDMERDWRIAFGPKGYAFAVKREDNSDVCTLHNGLTPQDKALARLISAAPDLLFALRDIWADEHVRSKLTYEQSIATMDALAKAEDWYKAEVTNA